MPVVRFGPREFQEDGRITQKVLLDGKIAGWIYRMPEETEWKLTQLLQIQLLSQKTYLSLTSARQAVKRLVETRLGSNVRRKIRVEGHRVVISLETEETL